MTCAKRRVMGVWASVAMVVGGALGGCSSMPPETGPTVGVRNDSDAPLRATFWIGDRAEQRPGAKAEMRAQETMEIPAYGTRQYRLGVFSGYESGTESFVRVQIQPVGTSFQPQTQYWYELNSPSPYAIRVCGKKPDLRFERAGGGTIALVPPELWFVNATAATAATRPPIRRVGAGGQVTGVGTE